MLYELVSEALVISIQNDPVTHRDVKEGLEARKHILIRDGKTRRRKVHVPITNVERLELVISHKHAVIAGSAVDLPTRDVSQADKRGESGKRILERLDAIDAVPIGEI